MVHVFNPSNYKDFCEYEAIRSYIIWPCLKIMLKHKPGMVVNAVIPALRGLKQDDLKFKSSLGYIVTCRLIRDTYQDLSKTSKTVLERLLSEFAALAEVPAHMSGGSGMYGTVLPVTPAPGDLTPSLDLLYTYAHTYTQICIEK